jgi:hypothetical protein
VFSVRPHFFLYLARAHEGKSEGAPLDQSTDDTHVLVAQASATTSRPTAACRRKLAGRGTI